MNVAADFWARSDRSGGTASCWPWLGACDRQGRGWCRYDGKVKFAHHVAEFLETGAWPRRAELKPCTLDSSCVNPAHFIRHRPDRRRTFRRAVKRSDAEISRLRAFALIIDRLHPDLRWLSELMGDLAAQFIAAHEGKQITLTMEIPTRAQMITEARAVDSYIQLHEARPKDRAEVLGQLARQYECPPSEITRFCMLGQTLLNGTSKESADEKKRR